MLFNALVILSDGRFAAVSVNDCVEFHGVQDLMDSWVGVQSNIAELRPEFLQDLGGRLRLTLPHLPHPANIGWRALPFSQVRRELRHLLREKRLLLRLAADGIAYSYTDFIHWYVLRRFVAGASFADLQPYFEYARLRWMEAGPHN